MKVVIFVVMLVLVTGAKLLEIKLRHDEIRSVKCEQLK